VEERYDTCIGGGGDGGDYDDCSTLRILEKHEKWPTVQ